MRTVLATLAVLTLTLGAFALAHGDEAETAKDALQALRGRMEVLEAEVQYLRAREADVSAYLLRNAQRADGLDAVAARAREAGFEAKSIPLESRRLLLRGMEGLAASLREGLPVPTPEQVKLQRQAEKLRAAGR